MYELFLNDEFGDMVEDKEADNFLDAITKAASWAEKIKPGYAIIIKDLSVIGL